MKTFLYNNWFKLLILGILTGISFVLIFGLIINPQKNRKIELNKIEKTAEQERVFIENKEKERMSKLNTCLEESEFQKLSSHLAKCGDENIARSAPSCFRVFGGTKNMDQVVISFEKEFPGKLPKEIKLSDVGLLNSDIWEKNMKERNDLVNDFLNTCNCGLEKTRREELIKEKEYRDSMCLGLHGK